MNRMQQAAVYRNGFGNRANLVDILIAHGDDKARSALRLFLTQDPCLQVAGTAENGQELLHLVASRRPDLVLLDWRLPGSPAAELLATLRAADEGLKIIVLISRPELREVVQRAGADGIINLWEPPRKVLTAILALMCEDDGILPEKHEASHL
jgi:DNA-binding NarL/FixJ family response regulator